MAADRLAVVVAMSGGVDSSAAAAYLVQDGLRVIGLTFRMWEDDAPAGAPPSGCQTRAAEAAARAARRLGIEHRALDLRDRFLDRVVEPFAREYLRGRTPNPCVECNRRVKFPALAEVADGLGTELMASGHYARIRMHEDGHRALLRASARGKDQSYALYGVEREYLSRCLFPNGERGKGEIRGTAARYGIEAAGRGESQEICFLRGGDYRGFLARRYPEAVSPGPLEDTSGKKLGEHRGIAFYTVGQRRGLGVSASRPLFVVALDPSRRAVILGAREEVPGTVLRAESPRWLEGCPPGDSFVAEAMARYNTEPVPCHVEVDGGGFEARFDERVWALTPGQHAVLYRGDRVLGGGVIACSR